MPEVETQKRFELEKYFPLLKVDEKDHTVFGLATCEKEDKDGEIADYVGTKKAYQEWSQEAFDSTSASGQDISLGNIRYMHQLVLAGKATKLKFDDDRQQIWLESSPSPAVNKGDPDIWPLLSGGYLRGYSQGGKYVSRKCNECKKDISGNFCKHCDKKVVVRYIPTISEVSYVDNPCLKEATFTLVKSDGSTEMKKFSETTLTEVIKAEMIPQLDKALSSMIRKAACSCPCKACKSGDCAGCGSDQKCSQSAKAVKYLVAKADEKHLPYTDEDGSVNRRLLAAAYAALFSPDGHKGNKYEGPDTAKAQKKIKQVYAANGWPTPTEKAAEIDELLKTGLADVIQNRAYGITKGMYEVSRFAELTESIKYLWLSLEWERESEQDESPVTDDIKEAYMTFLDHLLTYVEEEVSEAKEHEFINR